MDFNFLIMEKSLWKKIEYPEQTTSWPMSLSSSVTATVCGLSVWSALVSLMQVEVGLFVTLCLMFILLVCWKQIVSESIGNVATNCRRCV